MFMLIKVVDDDQELTVTVRAQQSAVKLMFWFVTFNNVLAHY